MLMEISWLTSTSYFHARQLPLSELIDLYDNLIELLKEGNSKH